MNNTATILENGESMEVSREELKRIRHLVYYCPECPGYHLWSENDFEDIEAVLNRKPEYLQYKTTV